MKTLLTLICFFLMTAAFGAEKDHFEILPGRLHKGGTMDVRVLSIDPVAKTMVVFFEYKILKRQLAPIPSEFLKGDLTQELPLKYEDERGYLELEIKKSELVSNAILKHLGRVQFDGSQDAHKVSIEPNNGKSVIQLIYHRSLPGLGWNSIKLMLRTSLPGLKEYQVEAKRKSLPQ
jgi:hypothetical protein